MKDSLVLKLLHWGLYASALMPLVIFSQFMSPFHFGKVIVFRTMVEIMVVLYLILIWQYPAYRPRFNKIHWAFLAFTLAFFLTSLTSIDVYLSWWGTLERMGGFWTFAHYFIFFVILTSVFRTRKEWLTLFNVIIGAAVLSAIYGFGQKTNIAFFIGSGNRARIFGTIGNAALFAGYQLLALFLALTLYFKETHSNRLKLFYGVSAVLMAIAVLMTVVRGSILALAVGLFIFTALKIWETRSQLAKRAFITLVIGGILFVGFSVLFKDSQIVKNSSFLTRLTDFSPETYTVKTRLWTWRAGLTGWMESAKTVLLGWGPDSYNYPFSKYFNPKFFRGLGSETLFDRAHNMFIEVLVTMGLIGFIAYLSIFSTALQSLWKKLKQRTSDAGYIVGLISLIIVYAIHNSFIFDTAANFIIFFSILGFISFLTSPPAEIPKEMRPRPLTAMKKAVVLVLGITVLIVIYNTNILTSRANYTTTRGIIQSWAGDFSGAVVKYKEAIAYDVAGKYEYRHRFAQYALEYSVSHKMTPEIREALSVASKEVQKNIDENQLDYLPYLYQSRIFITLGREDSKSPYNDEALKYSFEAQKLSPTFIRTYYEIGQAYLNKKNFVEAAKYFQEAVALNPDVGLSHWYLGIVEFDSGNIQKALASIDEALNRGFQPSEADYNRMLNMYLKLEDYNRIVAVYEQLIKMKPSNPQYYASMAASYAKVGRIDDAVNAAHRAAELDPSFESEARAFIKSFGRTW